MLNILHTFVLAIHEKNKSLTLKKRYNTIIIHKGFTPFNHLLTRPIHINKKKNNLEDKCKWVQS